MKYELVTRARRGDLGGVKRLIQKGVHVDAKNRNNQTALYCACERGHIVVAQYLLDNGASVDFGEKPLIAAAKYDHYDCVELLLQHNADVNCTNTELETPLSVALRKRHYFTILWLLQYNAIPPASISDHVTRRLLELAEVEHTEAIQKLVDDKIIDLMSKNTFLAAFKFAFQRGLVELAERMLLNDSYPKIEQLYPYAAYYSAKHNWPTLLSYLFQKGIDINATTNGHTPLYAACKKGHESVVTLLLNNGADPNVSLALHIVVQQRNAAVLNKLLEKGAKIDQTGEPLLHIACSETAALETVDEVGDARHVEQMSIIRQLLQQGVNANAISDKGDTALYRACKSGHLGLQVVQVLLKAGADVNLTSKRRYPLLAACKAGNVELINALIEAGADVRCSDSNNKTCLHAFINAYTSTTSDLHKHEDSFSIIDIKNTFALLLESGADVNAHCSLGETALYQASTTGLEHTMRLILETGADTTDSTRRRLLHAACERGYAHIVDLLLQHDSDHNALTVSGSLRLPVFCAVMKGYTHIVDMLLKYGADEQGQSGRSALICFIELLASQMCKTSRVVEPLNEKNLNILKNMLLSAGDVNKSDLDGRNALHIASSFGMCDVIIELMKRGANCNHLTFLGESALDLACENGHKAAVEMLLHHGAKPDKETATRPTYRQFGYNPQKSAMPVLCRAAEKGSETIVKSLLQYGANVNACDEKGNTALHLATSHSVVEILLNVGAKINVGNDNGDTPLGVVCKKRLTDASVVEMLLKFGADPNVSFLLHAACMNNDADTVQLLLAYGADANQLKLVPRTWCMYGVGMVSIEPSPLCIACKNRNMAMVVFLLQNGADVTFTDSQGNGLLHFAVEGLEDRADSEVYDPIVTLLLQHNAPVNAVSNTGETPLYMACRKGLTNVVKLLLICRADICLTKSNSNKYPLLIACQNKFRDIAMLLLERGADANVSIDCQTPLNFAAANGDIALVNQLLAYGADPCQMQNIGDTALHAAIRQCNNFVDVNIGPSGAEINLPLCLVCSTSDTVNIDVVQTLLEHGADPSITCPRCSDWSPSSWYQSLPLLSVAASCGNSELVLLLITFGAKLEHTDEFGGTALHFAIGYGDMTFLDELRCASTNSDTLTVEILLSAGADVNVLDISGTSPLFLACSRGRTEFVKLLLSRGADPNNGSKDKLPIHAACRGLHYESAKLLLEYKADVTSCDEKGKTALHNAVESIMCHPNPDNDKNAALVQLLLEAGVNVNAKFQNGESPIYVVCTKGLTTVATKMLECKADVDVDNGRKLPLIAACKNKHVSVVQLLLTHGADPNVPEEGNVSLHIAVTEDNSELVGLLLKHGANVDIANTDRNTALYLAIERCKSRASLRYADTDAFSSEKSIVDILLENKADVNTLNILGETPLYRAVAKELLDIVGKMLQVYGGNPNGGSPDKSPLVAACQKENVKLVDMLLNHGADPNLHKASANCDLASKHKLPLLVATGALNTDIMMSLLNAGASVNATNHEGRNAVCFAAEKLARYYSSKTKRILSAIRLLLQHGANFSMLLPDGHSPLHLLVDVLSVVTYDNRHSKCLLQLMQLMIEHGAMLLDSSSQLENNISGQSTSTELLATLATFDGRHKFIVDLFRAGAGFQLIASCCMEVALSMAAESITLCQAVVLAGYVPSSEELVQLRLAATNENTADGLLKQLVDWLNEDRHQVPSLFRQCRVAIRRQLSAAAQYRTILPAIDQLPLPNDVKLYLQFDGQMTEVDLSDVGNDEQEPQTGETTDSDDTSVDSSEQSDYDNDSDSDYNYDSDDDDISGSDDYNGSDSDQDLS